MEDYGVKYIARFESEVLGYVYEIKILKRNYSGDVMLRNLGGAPELIKDNNGAICGTSLEFLLETVTDGDLREFYTEDNKGFKTELWRNGRLCWVGFVVTETYTESMMPVSDVSIRATDGLGLLKNEPYEKTGKSSLISIIKYCADKSGLELDFDFRANIKINDTDRYGSFIEYSNDVEAGVLGEFDNCYDALIALLNNFALSITQSDGCWLIYQQTVVDRGLKFNQAAKPQGGVERNIVKIGSLDNADSDAIPVGALEMEVEPSRKSISVTEKQLTYPSFFLNWDFSINGHWLDRGRYVTIGEERCYFLPGVYPHFNAFDTLSQTIYSVDKTTNDIYLKLKYAVFTNDYDLNYQLQIVFKLRFYDTVYWLTRNGWVSGQVMPDSMLVFQVGEVTTQFGDTKWNNLELYLDGFPIYGELTISVYNIKSTVEITSDNVGLYVSEVRLMYEIPEKIEKRVLLTEDASKEETYDLVYGDDAYGLNVKFSAMRGAGTSMGWAFAGKEMKLSFHDLMCQVWANIYHRHRRKLRGTILLLKPVPGLLHDFVYLYDGLNYIILSGSYNLLTDEYDVELIEVEEFSEIIEKSLSSVRSVNVRESLYRASGEAEYRIYQNSSRGSMEPKMIRELMSVEKLNESFYFEVDNGFSESSEKIPLKSLADFLSQRFWARTELEIMENYLLYYKEKIKAGDSDLWDGHAFPDFLDQPVRRTDDVRFRSLQTENYAPGLSGGGARIDERGYAELTGLTLREFLEAPEYRYNRVDVVSGEQWNAPGFGLIESVDTGNRIATLKLEDQELAGIKVDDICRGLFHNLADNADGVVTDSCGFLTVAGFSTSYFTPVELLDDGKSFRYELKPGTSVHPSPAMKFAVYGNFTDTSRQASAYSTRTYKRYLKGVNTWEIDPQRNIAMQFGDLSGLYINGVDLSGYSAWLNNIYFSGYIEWTPGQLEDLRGKDGYTVNLTSYDAVVAVDSQGRIDNSVYDIINIVNGSELVQSAGMQVVTTRYKIQTEIQAYRGQTRLDHGDSPGEGVYTAAFTAKECEYSFAAGVLTVTAITGDKASVEIEVNCEDTATFTMKFVLTRVYDGAAGPAGPEGMISRVSEWAEGFYYRNDAETETEGPRYLDTVVVTDRSTGNFACYQAKAAHNGVASSEMNSPGNEAFWTRMSQLPPLYTPLILAENGVIRFAQSNQLLIQKEDGTVTAGASGRGSGAGGIRFWAGGGVPDSAPFRVDENGKMVADNADITGRITAGSGQIGGFTIEDRGLTVGSNANGVSIRPRTIVVRYQDSYTGTVTSRILAELGGDSSYLSKAPFYFYKKHSGNYYVPAMEIVSENDTSINIALRTTGNIASRNAVIEGGFARVNFDQYTVLNLRYGTKYEIYNAGAERFFYFPEVDEVKNMLGSLPVSLVVDVVAHHSTTARFYLKFTGGGTIYDRGGNAVDSYGMSRGNSVSFLLVYESASSYYAQIMQQNY